MNKLGTKIIITIIMVAIFMAPISAGIKINDKENLAVNIERNEIIAQEQTKTSTFEVLSKKIGYASAEFKIKITEPMDPNTDYNFNVRLYNTDIKTSDNLGEKVIDEGYGFTTSADTTDGHTITVCFGLSSTEGQPQCDKTTLTPNTNYRFAGTFAKTYSSPGDTFIYFPFKTGDKEKNTAGEITNETKVYYGQQDFGCGITNLPGCVLQIFYSLWQASAWVARMAGGFLDFFIYYATNSSSYSNAFVEQAWASVRDIANILFIIALLYVAIKTILGLNVTDNKKLIGVVIVIALIINFSLFTTKVVIDGSNILAKVFYNNIKSIDEKGTTSEAGAGGQVSISVGLVNKFNPQNIVMDSYNAGLGLGYSIFIILLLMAITLYTAYIFFSVALLFVARVVSLWISMIFSPLAFASYTVPFGIPGFGHKEWWTDLLKNSFLAPLFIFMLYIIVLFAGFLTDIAKYTNNPNLTGSENTIQRLMSIIIPFIILMVLLKKSKDLAVQYSGEMGKAIQSIAKTATGVAGGIAIGTAAAVGQGTLGHLGKMAFESKTLQDWQTTEGKGLGSRLKRFTGSSIRTASGAAATSSFDLRKGVGSTVLKGASALTGLNLGHETKFLMRESGGYEADLKRRDEKRKKRIEGLKVKEGEAEKQHLNQMKEEHQKVSLGNEEDIHEKDREIASAKGKRDTLKELANSTVEKGKDENGNYKDPEYAQRLKDYNDAAKKVSQLEGERSAIKKGGFNEKTGQYRTHNGNITQQEYLDSQAALESAEKAKVAADTAHTTALAEKDTAEIAANAASDAVRNAKFNTSGDATAIAKAVADAEKAEKEAQEKLATAITNVSETLKKKEITDTVLEKTEEKAKKAVIAKNYANINGGFGNSQNEYEDKLMPHAEHAVKHINDIRTAGFANNLENQWAMPWNKAARKKSAHEIRMGVKAESGHGGKDKGHHGGLLEEVIAASIAEAAVGHGHENKEHHTEHPAPAAATEKGGGAHKTGHDH